MIINSFQCWSESDSDRFQFRRTFPFLYPALLRLIRVYVRLNQNLLQTGRFQPFLRMPLVHWRTDLVAQNSFKSIELLYCLVFRYQSLLWSCCHQHSLGIFFVIKDRHCSARKPAWFCFGIAVSLQFSFLHPLPVELPFHNLFPCIKSCKESAVASFFFVPSLSRGMDTVPQDYYQFVVPFLFRSCEWTFCGLRSEWAFRLPAYSPWFKSVWSFCCQLSLADFCSEERSQLCMGCLRLEKLCEINFSVSFISALGRFPGFSVRSSYLWLISQFRVCVDPVVANFHAAFSLSRRTDLMFSTHCEPNLVSISSLRVISLLRPAPKSGFTTVLHTYNHLKNLIPLSCDSFFKSGSQAALWTILLQVWLL
jgi:hypothetical protein